MKGNKVKINLNKKNAIFNAVVYTSLGIVLMVSGLYSSQTIVIISSVAVSLCALYWIIKAWKLIKIKI